MKKIVALTVSVAAIGLGGCGEGDSKPGDNPLNAPADYVSGVAKAQQSAVKTVDAASINQAIQMFEVSEGRRPGSLEELVSKKYMPAIPEPPRGMKFNYDATKGIVTVVPQ